MFLPQICVFFAGHINEEVLKGVMHEPEREQRILRPK
jgi:hypothetical protein